MAQTDHVFSGSVPELYDALLVPLIFEPYAADLARRAASENPADILETAAGTGVVSRALAPLLGPKARYVVTDLNPPMLERASLRQAPDPRIAWQQADALHLAFDDASFDLVCCQFGAMFFPDRVAGYKEARRVLRQGGRFLFNVWGPIEDNRFADLVTQAAATVFPNDPPRFLARTPHGYHDVKQIEADLRAAGFDDIAIQTVDAESKAESAHAAARAYCYGTPLRGEIEARDPVALDRVTQVAAQAIEQAFGQGPISGPIRARVIVARR